MAPGRIVERNVRPRVSRAESEEDDSQEDVDGSNESGSASNSDADSEEDASSVGTSDGEDESDLAGDRLSEEGRVEDEHEDDVDVEQQIGSVSFGALKQAQDVLVRKRKRGSDESPDQDAKLEALRARLRQMREEKAATQPAAKTSDKLKQSRITEDVEQGSDDHDSGSDSAPSEEDAPTSRSKHAPMAQSSKYQVSRKRQIVDLPQRKTRDPRFDAFNSQSSQPGNSDKAYSFLRDYQKDEISQLKSAIKATKSAEDKETLKRKMMAMENRIKAKEAEERQQSVLREHRKVEKGKIEQGKKPFYLKRGELKERALKEKFKNMKGKEREKVIEKRRLKESQKEKRRMPQQRRAPG